MKFNYGQEVVVVSSPYKNYRGVIDSRDGDNMWKVVMYAPIHKVLTFSEDEIISTEQFYAPVSN